MKTKYLLLYVLVGIAFLAVSAWVFFTKGKSAKAIHAKYRLGGIMLTCMAMLSAASCGQVSSPPEVMCYDVVAVPTDNIVSLSIKSSNTSYKSGELTSGDIISVKIQTPTHKKYILTVIRDNSEGTLLQSTELIISDPGNAFFDVSLSESVSYKGTAIVLLQGIDESDGEEPIRITYEGMNIKIL